MSDLCQVTPISAFQSTNLNNHIDCIKGLGQRILRLLGHPMINVELHPDQLHDAIAMATEMFSKYSSTKECIIFDSRLYEPHKGIRLDHLFTVANTNFTLSEKLQETNRPNPDTDIEFRENLYISLSSIPQSYFASSSALSSNVPITGISNMQILDQDTFTSITSFAPNLSSLFLQSPQKTFTMSCEPVADVSKINNMFDYDLMDYRKIVSVTDFEEGSSNGISSLFSQESIMAQQAFSMGHGVGSFGFDLLSFHTMRDWMDTREKILATRRDFSFDDRTQYLKFYPQPKHGGHFYGVITAYVERPLRDLIKEKWVLEYATALSKIMWGRVLGKVTGAQLLDGATLNGSDVLSEGNADKEKLETMLFEGGYGDYQMMGMLVG
jgi:hypothetical protein